jgi:DNA modification methylase
VERRPLASLIAYARNARLHSEAQVAQIAASIVQWGWTMPVLIDERGEIIAGHGRALAAAHLGLTDIPVMVARGWTEEQKRAYVIADNKLTLNASWDESLLKLELADLREVGFDLGLTGFSSDELGALWAGPAPSTAGNLAERFGVPPFSVLNAREGWWQDRKAAWLRLGIQSELGRGDEDGKSAVPGGSRMPAVNPATGKIVRSDSKARPITEERIANAKPAGGGGGGWEDPTLYARKRKAEHLLGRALTLDEFRAHEERSPPAIEGGLTLGAVENFEGAGTMSGTSIFDPVLCELAYRWFCPPDGAVLDPFAGGSVRGIVAARLGRRYVGVDLSGRQLDANRAQARTILRPEEPQPKWITGDSRQIHELAQGCNADFVFSCPPYADLERYSNDPADLSTLDYAAFRKALGEIIGKACGHLKADRFACFVVGDVRDNRGNYHGFPSHVIEAFQSAGLALYNEAILVTAAGTLPIRAAKQFSHSRKLGKTHQNVLIFVKGDPRIAALAIGEAEFGAISDEEPAGDGAPLGGEIT